MLWKYWAPSQSSCDLWSSRYYQPVPVVYWLLIIQFQLLFSLYSSSLHKLFCCVNGPHCTPWANSLNLFWFLGERMFFLFIIMNSPGNIFCEVVLFASPNLFSFWSYPVMSSYSYFGGKIESRLSHMWCIFTVLPEIWLFMQCMQLFAFSVCFMSSDLLQQKWF